MGFNKNIFINCPFDEDYQPLLKPLLFTVKKIGFSPRIALERSDSSEVRLHKIKELLESSRYSIHDLSRAKSKSIGEYFRQNMAFELGLDLGCRDYHPKRSYKSKRMLILEEERYSTQKSLSDLSFADCKSHDGQALKLVKQVRSWFAENGYKGIPSPSTLWDDYNDFYANFYAEKINEGFKAEDIDELPLVEFMDFIDEKLQQ